MKTNSRADTRKTRPFLRKTLIQALAMAGLLGGLCATPAFADDAGDVSKLLKGGHYAEALTKANTVLAQKPRDAQMRFLKGVALTEMNKPSEAIAIFARLSEDFPELPEPHNNLAVLYASSGQFDKARAALDMAMRTNPSYATALENLGDVNARIASQAYDKALQLDSRNSTAKSKLTLLTALGNGSKAASAAATAVAPAAAPVAAATPAVAAPAAKAPVPAAAAPVAAPVAPVVAKAAAPVPVPQPVAVAKPAAQPAPVVVASVTPAAKPAVAPPAVAVASVTPAAKPAPVQPVPAQPVPAAVAKPAATTPPVVVASVTPAAKPAPAPVPVAAPAAAAAALAKPSVVASVTPAAKPVQAAPAPAAKPAVDPAVAKAAKALENDKDDVLRVVNGWARAWSARDVGNYLDFYAHDFQTPGGISRKAWAEERHVRIKGKGRISVSIENPQVTINDKPATVVFRQVYVSDRLRANGRKTLLLVKQGGKWQIKQERAGS